MRKNKNHILLFLIIIAGLVMGTIMIIKSCNNPEQTGESKESLTSIGNVTFDSLVVDTVAKLSDSQPNATAHIHLSIMYAKNNDNINKSIASCGIFFPENINTDSIPLNEVAHLFAKQFIEDFKRDYKDIYSVEEGATQLNVSYTVSTKIEAATDKSFAYVATVYQQNGGPHPIKVIYTKNIDPKTGRSLELEDFFVSEYHHKLSDHIVAALEKQQQVSTYPELQEKGYFAGIDPYPSKNFIVSNDAITFIYNEDEISAHDKGETRVKLTKEELKGILK